MATRRNRRDVHGWLVLDKPEGLSSNQALGRVRHLFNARKAGHAGTLDPLASGLLPIALGEATKTVSFAQAGTKVYSVDIAWGQATETDDREGAVIAESDLRPDADSIRAALPAFTGVISQKPPTYSAIKVKGRRAYALARAGDAPDLAPRQVEISRLQLVDTPTQELARFEVVCAKGTYIRALARDLGVKLGTYGHVAALRRTRVGPFDESAMISLDKLQSLRHIGAGCGRLHDVLLPIETVLDDIPVLALSEPEATRLRLGQAITPRDHDAPFHNGTVLATSKRCPIAIAELNQGMLHPKRVFNLDSNPVEGEHET